MSDIEELQKRKEQLLLERDITQLQRNKRLTTTFQGWSWLWVAPLSCFSVFMLVMGLSELNRNGIVGIALAAVTITPLVLKVFWKP